MRPPVRIPHIGTVGYCQQYFICLYADDCDYKTKEKETRKEENEIMKNDEEQKKLLTN